MIIMATKANKYRYCFVPKCLNTSTATPDMLFLYLPKNEALRKKWYNAARREGPVVTLARSCCEDHFQSYYALAKSVLV